ncbi:CMRF35-like molecule 8 isoform X2 [Acipenser ruthenus]|uniref:CMRF35-like molecule 8 isoform X2 n=1 Tax=Acipenser ruthenus TaxID=7906 RepID=UPI002741AACF|nr:CMRF35-like molecule 8 isoform X2 [Acipenser ruthenus]
MKAIVEVTICLITVLGSVKSAEVFYGIEGGNVKIDCPYQPEYNDNKKYLCHTRWMLINALISSGEPETLVTKGRFSLYDNRSASVFTVTITELTQKDAGTYYCGVDINWSTDKYTEVKVTVNKAPKTPPTTTRATRSSTTPSTTTVKGNTDNGQTRDCTSSSPAADTHSEATAKTATEEKITEKAPVKTGLEVIIGGALGAMLFVFLMTIMIYCFTKKKVNKSVDKSATTKNPASAVVLGTITNTVYSEVMNPVHSVTPNPVYSEVMKPVHSVTPNSVYSEVMKPVQGVTPNSVYSEVMKPVHSVTPNSVYSEVMNPVHSVTPNSVYSEAADVTQANDIVYSEVMKVTSDSDVETVYSNAGFEGKHDAKESAVYSVIEPQAH